MHGAAPDAVRAFAPALQAPISANELDFEANPATASSTELKLAPTVRWSLRQQPQWLTSLTVALDDAAPLSDDNWPNAPDVYLYVDVPLAATTIPRERASLFIRIQQSNFAPPACTCSTRELPTSLWQKPAYYINFAPSECQIPDQLDRARLMIRIAGHVQTDRELHFDVYQLLYDKVAEVDKLYDAIPPAYPPAATATSSSSSSATVSNSTMRTPPKSLTTSAAADPQLLQKLRRLQTQHRHTPLFLSPTNLFPRLFQLLSPTTTSRLPNPRQFQPL